MCLSRVYCMTPGQNRGLVSGPGCWVLVPADPAAREEGSLPRSTSLTSGLNLLKRPKVRTIFPHAGEGSETLLSFQEGAIITLLIPDEKDGWLYGELDRSKQWVYTGRRVIPHLYPAPRPAPRPRTSTSHLEPAPEGGFPDSRVPTHSRSVASQHDVVVLPPTAHRRVSTWDKGGVGRLENLTRI